MIKKRGKNLKDLGRLRSNCVMRELRRDHDGLFRAKRSSSFPNIDQKFNDEAPILRVIAPFLKL
jgi:hypothetical protein